MSRKPTTSDLLLIHDGLERHVQAVRTYINTGEMRLARASLSLAKHSLNTLEFEMQFQRIENNTNESEKE